MKLDLSEMARIPGSYAEHAIDLRLTEIEGMTLTAPICGNLTVSSTGNVLLLEGAVDTELEQVCFRCGITYRLPVHAEFQEDFVVRPPHAPGAGPRVEEEEEAPDTRLFIEGTLDLHLDELLRQSILVALPMKPLCTPECRGLCPHCGHRLEEGACACAPDGGTPRFAELRRLLEERQRKGV